MICPFFHFFPQYLFVIIAIIVKKFYLVNPTKIHKKLMKLTKILTRDSTEDVENMYRRMCFNVFAHNRDDHSKNFTYIYNEKDDMWRLSPANDLTYSNTYYGEHTTTVDGNGKNPSVCK